MPKKIIKLINSERITLKIKSAQACDSTSIDTCFEMDSDRHAQGEGCTLYAFDFCTKDYAVCSEGADDNCLYDYDSCVGAGVEDLN